MEQFDAKGILLVLHADSSLFQCMSGPKAQRKRWMGMVVDMSVYK